MAREGPSLTGGPYGARIQFSPKKNFLTGPSLQAWADGEFPVTGGMQARVPTHRVFNGGNENRVGGLNQVVCVTCFAQGG